MRKSRFSQPLRVPGCAAVLDERVLREIDRAKLEEEALWSICDAAHLEKDLPLHCSMFRLCSVHLRRGLRTGLRQMYRTSPPF